MKKIMTGAMTAVLLASTAVPAFAQRGPGGYPDGDPRNSGGHARSGAWINRNPDAQPAPAQAAPAQAAPPERSREDGGRNWNGGGRRGDGDAAQGAAQAAPPERSREDGGRNWNGGGRRGGDGDTARGFRNQGLPGDRPAAERNEAERVQGDRDRGDRDRGDRNWGDRDRGDRNWSGQRNWSGDQNWRERRDRPRYDRRAYPPVYRSHQRFRGGFYRPPSGFYARSWVFGDILPYGWYGSQYYIDDWWTYGLPIPPAGYEWVRIGDDAALVDTFNGRIVQVVYDLFW